MVNHKTYEWTGEKEKIGFAKVLDNFNEKISAVRGRKVRNDGILIRQYLLFFLFLVYQYPIG